MRLFNNLKKMLISYLNTVPYSKFLLIDDSIEELGIDILQFLIKSRLKLLKCEVHYLIFEGNYKKKSIEKATNYDFTSDLINRKSNQEKLTIENVISNIAYPSVIFIDSLIHVIFKYGIKNTYRLLHNIINSENIYQIATVFHSDLIEDDTFLRQFQHLSTFSISLEPKFHSNRSRLVYVYKKSSGKIIKQIEEFYFENDLLKTEAVKKLDPQILAQEVVKEIEPDKLTTFKISVESEEKKAKESLVLPYLPKENSKEGGKIFYQFDEIDDWDEEDPDDDLNI